MSEEVKRKCYYYNSGYCKFSRREKGCKFFHPEENCKLSKCKDKLCPNRHPKTCKFGEECRYQTKCSYSHVGIFERNETSEITRLKGDIENLKTEIYVLNVENNIKLNTIAEDYSRELEELRFQNINITHKLQQSEKEYEIILAVKDDELVKLSENMKLLETKSSTDTVFEKKAIELFRHTIFNDDSDADIKMYVILKKGWQMKYFLDENVTCPDCANDFEDISQLREHDKKHPFTCYGCGECFKEKENSTHWCGSEHVFDREPLEGR